MWTKLARPFRSGGDSDNGWLDSPFRPHLYTLNLEQATDPLDADALWEDLYGGGSRIVEKFSQNPQRRLRAALDSHRWIVSKPDARGKRIPVRYVFTDVVISISEPLWRRELMIGADGLETLVHNLAFRHREDFRQSLPPDRAPHYVVVPRSDLASHEVALQFGYGVFVPGPDDVLQSTWHVRRLEGEQVSPLPSWPFFREGRPLERPVGLYEAQRFLLLTSSETLGPVTLPVWFSRPEGYILLTREPRQGWQAFADEDWIHLAAVETGSSGAVTFRFQDTGCSNPEDFTACLILEVRPHDMSAVVAEEKDLSTRPVDMAARIAARGEVAWGSTLIPGHSPVTSTLLPEHRLVTRYPYALLLEGIALPRIDGRQIIPGLEGWILWLDEAGDPLSNSLDREKVDRLPALSARREKAVLQGRPLGSSRFQPVTRFPYFLEVNNGALEVVTSPLSERYLGILHLLHPLEFLLDERVIGLGREASQDASQPWIALDQLAHPNSLIWKPGKTQSGRLGDIGLSRRHVQVQVRKDRLQLSMLQGKTPVYMLNDTGELKQSLLPDSQEAGYLAPGERLLLGNYLLRFIASR